MVLGEIDVKMYIGFSKVSGSIIAGNFWTAISSF
jgi:hypothetical protein